MFMGLAIWTGIVLIIALVLTGCNTIAGFGQDINIAAKGIQEKMATPRNSRKRMNDEGVYYANE